MFFEISITILLSLIIIILYNINTINRESINRTIKQKSFYRQFSISFQYKYYFINDKRNPKKLIQRFNTIIVNVKNDNLSLQTTVFRDVVFDYLKKELRDKDNPLNNCFFDYFEITSITFIKECDFHNSGSILIN